uniref:Acid phosphatase n=1 Tax=Aegilops tauschii subsp. strangulata TaxID=200361 RepID=A0A453SQV1_AEGTS
ARIRVGDPRLSHSEIAGLLLTHTVNLLFDCRLELFDHQEFDRWVETGEAPVIPSSLRLYSEVRDLGLKTFLLTGRSEAHEGRKSCRGPTIRRCRCYIWRSYRCRPKGQPSSDTTS